MFKLSLREGKNRILFITSVFVFIIGIFANISLPFLFKNIVNKLYFSHYDKIFLLAFSYGLIWVINQANIYIKDFFYNKVEFHFTASIINSILDKVFHLSFEQYQNMKTGEIINIIQRTQQSVSTVMMSMLFNITPTIIEITIISCLLFHFYPIKYSIVLLSTLFSFLIYNVFFSHHVASLSNQYVETEKNTSSKIVDMLMAYDTVKYFHVFKNAKIIYSKQLKIWETNFSKSRTLLSLIHIGQVVVLGVGITILLVFCSSGAQHNQIKAG